MPRLQLQIFQYPPVARIVMNIRRQDGEDYLLEAEVDTGAQVSLLPMRLMEIFDYRLIDETQITIDRSTEKHNPVKDLEQ